MRECFVCSTNQNVSKYYRIDGFDYVKCATCELIFVNEVAPTEELYTAYDGGWWKAFRRKILSPFRTFDQIPNLQRSLDRADRIFQFVSSHYQRPSKDATLLDIGCNKGFLLVKAAEAGYNVYGIELVAVLLEQFRRKYLKFANQVFAGRFMDLQSTLRDDMFNIITAIDVIEHLEDPIGDFSNIYRILKPGGIFVIQTPDGDCQEAKAEKDQWGALKPLEHLQLFSRKNLDIFAKKAGFRNIQFSEPFEHADGNFVAVIRK